MRQNIQSVAGARETPAPYYVRLARGQTPFPRSYSTWDLGVITRQMASHREQDPDAWLDDPVTREERPERVEEEAHKLYARIITSSVAEELEEWRDHGRARHALAHRLELLELLAKSKKTAETRRTLAIQQVIQQLDFHGGWDRAATFGGDYQLGVQRPWYKPGDFEHTHAQFIGARQDPDTLEQLGFVQITSQTYLDRVRRPIMQRLLKEDDALMRAAAIIALYTVGRGERQRMLRVTGQIWDELAKAAKDFFQQHTTAVPIYSLYSLAKEARNICGFADELKIVVRVDNDQIASSKVTDGYAMLQERESGQGVLFFDKKLVERTSNKAKRPDQFIEIPVEFDVVKPSVLDAIMKALERLPIEERLMEHLPRVTAAFFNAAQRDRRLRIGHDGAFWDSESGKRLCRLAGFDPSNYRHRAIIKDIRELLCGIILHREVSAVEHGKRRKLKWKGPLLQPLQAELELSEEDREGLTNHQTLKSWIIADALWRMVTPLEQGGAPAFMALDERAFYLDTRSSVPFNLYWMLVNRAYMDRLSDKGSLSLRLGLLYEWAGLQGRFERPSRLRPVLIQALDLMLEHGLLSEWSCAALESDDYILFDELLAQELHVTFSTSHIEALEHLLPGRT